MDEAGCHANRLKLVAFAHQGFFCPGGIALRCLEPVTELYMGPEC